MFDCSSTSNFAISKKNSLTFSLLCSKSTELVSLLTLGLILKKI